MTDSNGSRTLFQSLRVPIDLKAIFLAFLGLVVLWAGGQVLNLAYEGVAVSKAYGDWSKSEAGKNATDEQKDKMRDQISDRTEINVNACVVHAALGKLKVPLSSLPVIGAEISTVVDRLYGPQRYRAVYEIEAGEKRGLSTIEFIIGLVWWFLILAVFGGAICRMVASRIARDEGVGVKEAIGFALKNLPSYFFAPVAVGLAILFFWACILLAGLVVSIPFIGPFLTVILYPLVILAGLIIILIGFGGLLGLLLMVTAVSTESNGPLDAVSRAFSYIYSRPLQFFFAYFLIFLFAYIILFVGTIFVNVTASSFDTGVAADNLSGLLVQNVGADAYEPTTEGGEKLYGIAAFLIWLFHRILWWGIGGYVVYYILGGTTSIYFQLRRDVDGTEESEIYLADGEEDEFDFAVSEPPAPADDAAPAPAPAPAADEAPAPAEEPAAEAPPPADEVVADVAEPEPEAEPEGEPEGEDERKPDGEGGA